MPDQDTQTTGAGSPPPCPASPPVDPPSVGCYWSRVTPTGVGCECQLIDGRTGEVVAEGVTYRDPETGGIKVDLESPADTPAVVEVSP